MVKAEGTILDLPISWVVDFSEPPGGTNSPSALQSGRRAPLNFVRKACGIFKTSGNPESYALAWPSYHA